MSIMLFIGGPIHGQRQFVPPDMDVVRVPLTAEQSRQEGGAVLLGQMATYIRRSIAVGDDKHKTERALMVDDQVPPDAAMSALAQVLLFAWVTEPERPGAGLGWPPAEIPAVEPPEVRDYLKPADTHAQRRVAALERASQRAATRRALIEGVPQTGA